MGRLLGLIVIVGIVAFIYAKSDTSSSRPAGRPAERYGRPETTPAGRTNSRTPEQAHPATRRASSTDGNTAAAYSPAAYTAPAATTTRTVSQTRGPEGGTQGRSTEHAVINGEGEVYLVDTALSGSPFYGPVWDKILTALEREEYVRARILFRRRAANNYFSGYETDIDGVHGFLPRSKCGYFWNEELDATGKSIIVKPFLVHPSGPRKGSLLVDAVAPLHELDKEKQREWSIGIDFDPQKFYLACGKYKTLWCHPSEIASILHPSLGIRSLAEATGRYYRIASSRTGEPGRVLPIEVLS